MLTISTIALEQGRLPWSRFPKGQHRRKLFPGGTASLLPKVIRLYELKRKNAPRDISGMPVIFSSGFESSYRMHGGVPGKIQL